LDADAQQHRTGKARCRLEVPFNLTSDTVTLDAQRSQTGWFEQIASNKDHRMFQQYLDDAEVQPLEGFPATGSWAANVAFAMPEPLVLAKQITTVNLV
jgi:hypothetical protein